MKIPPPISPNSKDTQKMTFQTWKDALPAHLIEALAPTGALEILAENWIESDPAPLPDACEAEEDDCDDCGGEDSWLDAYWESRYDYGDCDY